MAQGWLHRGVAVCNGAPGLPVTQPAPGLASFFFVPQAITARVSAQVHHGVGTECDELGPLGSSAARPGLGMGGNEGETAARPGQGPEPTATVLTALGRWHLPAATAVGIPMNYREAPRAKGECGDHDGRGGPPCYSGRDVARPACLEMRRGPRFLSAEGRQPLPMPGGIQRPPRSVGSCCPWGAPFAVAPRGRHVRLNKGEAPQPHTVEGRHPLL